MPPKDPQDSFKGKNVIVTGSNTGLGLEAAIKFVKLNAQKVIITSRNTEKGAAAKAIIDLQTQRGSCVEVWKLDLDSYDSIRKFAKRASELEHLDVVILNAGAASRYLKKAPTGWDEILQVNVLSTTVLALMLLPKLRSSKTAEYTPRLEFVGARIHEDVVMGEEQRNAPNILEWYNSTTSADNYPTHRQYSVSKLFLICTMRTIANMALGGDGEPEVIVNAVCPGACQSELTRDYNSGGFKLVKAIAGAAIMKTAEQGARTYLIGVTIGRESHGGFIQHADIRP